jgi:hypothetical protein
LLTRVRIVLLASSAFAIVLPSQTAAHEIPASVVVHAYVKPDRQKLQLLVRVPLASMRDVVFPTHGPGYLDLAGVEPLLPGLARLWIADYVQLYENGRRLPTPRVAATRVSLPSDPSFGAYESAFAQLSAPPLARDTELVLEQAMLDVRLEYAIGSERSEFAIAPALAHLGGRTTTVLRFLSPNGAERVFSYTGNPGRVRLDPRWHHAALQFVKLGFLHILDGIDHLLFLLCLVIPFRRVRPLLLIVTSFTVAHSITLIASVIGLAPSALWFPPLIELLIALSILYTACENMLGPKLERRWVIAFGFGLAHGFGFAFALRESLQFAGSHLATSLVTFNVGVELGQLLVILLAVPVLDAMFRRAASAEKAVTILICALVAHTAWHWASTRAAALRQYRFSWPALDLALLAGVLRWLTLALILAGAVWLLFGLYGRLVRPRPALDRNVAPERRPTRA